MEKLFFSPREYFKTADKDLYPEKINLTCKLQNSQARQADVDIIIGSHNLASITNLTIQSYLRYETDLKIHIIVVESSGKDTVFRDIIDHPQVSKVLLDNISIKGKVHGYGSYGLALSNAIGIQLSRSPLIFFSHSDMVACKPQFISYLKSKLGPARAASFTQRHIIPFVGCMLVTRQLLEERTIDWLPMDENPYLKETGLLPLGEMVTHLNHIDCGEQYIYYELAQHRPIYISASRGGSTDWWKDPMGYYDLAPEALTAWVKQTGASLNFGHLNCTKEKFKQKHLDLINAGQEGFWVFQKPKWWRYCFDDSGDLIFIHHGRGSTEREVKRWVRFGLKNFSQPLASANL
ncbi:MAG: glycosyltransferase family 2 protein [Bacteriovoracia bacterium]